MAVYEVSGRKSRLIWDIYITIIQDLCIYKRSIHTPYPYHPERRITTTSPTAV